MPTSGRVEHTKSGSWLLDRSVAASEVTSGLTSRISTLGRVTSTHPIDRRLSRQPWYLTEEAETFLFSPPDIPFLSGPPTTVSAASISPSSSMVCSTMILIASFERVVGRRSFAAYEVSTGGRGTCVRTRIGEGFAHCKISLIPRSRM